VSPPTRGDPGGVGAGARDIPLTFLGGSFSMAITNASVNKNMSTSFTTLNDKHCGERERERER